MAGYVPVATRAEWYGWQTGTGGSATLSYKIRHGWWYHIDLLECGTSAQQLDWIFQVSEKTWATPEVVAGLINGLRDLLGRRVAACGHDHPFTEPEIRKRLKAYRERVLTV